MPDNFNKDTDYTLYGTDYSMPEDEPLPKEEAYSFDEYNLNVKPKVEEEDKRSVFKKQILKPIIAMVTLLAVILPAAAIDPLGILNLKRVSTAPAYDVSGGTVDPVPAETENSSVETSVSVTTDAETEETVPPEEEDEFPVLGNLNPDFAGDYAWSDDGSEEYIRFSNTGEAVAKYLVKGGAWDTYDPTGVLVEDASAVYDKSSNTLTLNGFSCGILDVNLMGNGFTVELHGDNHIESISVWGAMYGGSIKFTGDGSLTVDNGIMMNCEASESCLMIAKGVTLDISGDPAVGVVETLMSGKAIYVSKYLDVTGGAVSQFGDTVTDNEGNSLYVYTFTDVDGNPSTHIHIEPKK